MTVVEKPITLIDRAIARGHVAEDRLMPVLPTYRAKAKALIESREPVWVRLRELRHIADTLTAMYTDQVACREGCSHCCHIAVSVLGPEAEMIGQEIGRKPKKPVGDKPFEPPPSLPFNYEHPCTFLKDDRCSIYESRPMACRVYGSLADNEDPCRLDGPHDVPQMDLTFIFHAYLYICANHTRHAPLKADIRKFWPRKI